MRPIIPTSYYPMLLALSSARPKVRTLILKCLDRGTIRVLAQLAANIMYGNIPLDKRQVRHFRRFKSLVKLLSYKYANTEQKREALLQQGGFLPLLLPIISSIAGALVSKAIK